MNKRPTDYFGSDHSGDEFKRVTEVSFPSSDPSCQLYGDLTLPPIPIPQGNCKGLCRGRYCPHEAAALIPAIVFVNNSNDRNGNTTSLQMNTSNRFAEHITASSRPTVDNRAIAVLTYDKRGVGKSVRVPYDEQFQKRSCMMDSSVNDAVEAVRFVAGHPRIDKSKIVLLGNAGGAILMPLICRQVKNNNLDPIFGCIFYNSFGENAIDNIKLLNKTIVKEVREMATGLKGWLQRMWFTDKRVEKMLKANYSKEWVQDCLSYDAHEELAKNISCHCLAISGMNRYDAQNEFCDPDTAAKLVPNAKSMEAHLLPNLTNVLRSMESEVRVLNCAQDFAMMGTMPLDPELLRITDSWCDRILFDGNEENTQYMINKEQHMIKTKVSFPSSDPSCQLYGDLILPNGATALIPAIVFVNGPGLDRNGNTTSLQMTLNTSNRFAEHITASSRPTADNRAIAVLTYDNRGVGKSVRVPYDKQFQNRACMIYNVVNDAMEAVRFVAGHPRIDKSKIVLLGNSEGAILMPLICRQVKNNNLDPIFGCIFYNGFGENVTDNMKLQRETIVKEVREMATGVKGWWLRMRFTDKRVEKMLKAKFCKVCQQEYFSYDAHEELAKNISCHCLAISGMKRYYQVRNEFCDPDTAAKLAPNAKSMEAHLLPNLTNLLRSMEGEVRILNMMKDYAMMGTMPLDPELLKITDAWCDRILFDGNEENMRAQ